jgi:hypothetical protein
MAAGNREAPALGFKEGAFWILCEAIDVPESNRSSIGGLGAFGLAGRFVIGGRSACGLLIEVDGAEN